MIDGDYYMHQVATRRGIVLFFQVIALWFFSSLSYSHQYIMRTSLVSLSTAWLSLNNMDYQRISWLAAGYYFTYIILQPIAGVLIFIVDTRKILCLSSLWVALACFLTTTFHSFTGLLFARVLCGIGGAFSLVGTLTIAKKLFSKDTFPIISSLTFVIGGLGVFISGAPLYLIVSKFDWGVAMLILGFASLLIAMSILLLKPTTYESSHISPLIKKEPVVDNNHKISLKLVVLDVFRLKRFWAICLYSGFLFLPIPALSVCWLELYEKMLFHKPAALLQLSSSMLFLGYITGSLFSGCIIMKVKNQQLLLLVAPAMAFITVSILLYVNLMNHFYLFNVILVAVGFFCSFALLSPPLLLTLFPERSLPIALSIATCSLAVVGAFEIPIIGAIIDHRHILHPILTLVDFRHAFILIPLSPLLAIFIGIFAFKGDKQSQ